MYEIQQVKYDQTFFSWIQLSIIVNESYDLWYSWYYKEYRYQEIRDSTLSNLLLLHVTWTLRVEPVYIPHFNTYKAIGNHDDRERHHGIEVKVNFVPERIELIVIGIVAFKMCYFNFGRDVQIVGYISFEICDLSIEKQNMTIQKKNDAYDQLEEVRIS